LHVPKCGSPGLHALARYTTHRPSHHLRLQDYPACHVRVHAHTCVPALALPELSGTGVLRSTVDTQCVAVRRQELLELHGLHVGGYPGSGIVLSSCVGARLWHMHRRLTRQRDSTLRWRRL